jgi:hypothetical protein
VLFEHLQPARCVFLDTQRLVIVATLKHSGRQHTLVTDEDPFTQKIMVRGVFSASQIARQLGIVTGQNDLSETFAHIDQAIRQRVVTESTRDSLRFKLA